MVANTVHASDEGPEVRPEGCCRGRYRFLVVFLTGAITLALELLVSRILAPFFGVSLYIWTGILSITLVALAVGYYLGGWVAHRAVRSGGDRLLLIFSMMPALVATSLFVSCIAYPKCFLAIAQWDLVLGSFVASGMLLAVPLVCASSMNPLLVALIGINKAGSFGADDREMGSGNSQCPHDGQHPDAGSGKVFFVSTIGSVVGVLATTFVMVPRLTNFHSLLVLAILAAFLSLASGVLERAISPANRRRLCAFAILAVLVNGVLLVFGTRYLGKNVAINFGGVQWRILEEVPSFYGNIKVVEMKQDARGDNGMAPVVFTSLFNDGTVQGEIGPNGQSSMLYGYGVESLVTGLSPDAERILLLGLGTGALPMRLQASARSRKAYLEMHAVDIEPACEQIATQYFGYNPEVAEIRVEDARTYLRGYEGPPYDVIIFDLYRGDISVPEYMLTLEAIADMKRCLTEKGVVVFNLSASLDQGINRSQLCTIKTISAVLPHTLCYFREDTRAFHVLVAASSRQLEHRLAALRNVPGPLHEALSALLREPKVLDAHQLSRSVLLTDESNVFSQVRAKDAVSQLRSLLGSWPVELMLN
jgi:spermidine synthase